MVLEFGLIQSDRKESAPRWVLAVQGSFRLFKESSIEKPWDQGAHYYGSEMGSAGRQPDPKSYLPHSEWLLDKTGVASRFIVWSYNPLPSTGSSGWSFHLNRTSFMQQTRETSFQCIPYPFLGENSLLSQATLLRTLFRPRLLSILCL